MNNIDYKKQLTQKYEQLKIQIDEWYNESIKLINKISSKPPYATFEALNIPIGTTLYYKFNSDIRVVTLDNRNLVAYNNKTYSITGIGCHLRHEEGKSGDSGFNLFRLEPNGKTLYELHKEICIEEIEEE